MLNLLPAGIRNALQLLPLPDSWLEALRNIAEREEELDYMREERKPGSWRMPMAIGITVAGAYVVYLIMR